MTRVSSYLTATVPALVVLGFFVWFANWIPQTRWDPPAAREITADMTPRQLANVGEVIVRERGCLACHTIEPGAGVKGQGRGPNLANIAQRRAQGVAGGPDDLLGYLVQALHEPGAYLVEGYGNIMPVSTRPPAKLSREEVAAVIAHLQTLGGQPSVTIADVPGLATDTVGAVQATGAAAADGAALTDPGAILATFTCLDCHSMQPEEVLLGPPLDAGSLREVAAEQGMSAEAYLMESIVEPRAVERDDFPPETMPDDYGELLTAAQLHTIVRYLLGPEGDQ